MPASATWASLATGLFKATVNTILCVPAADLDVARSRRLYVLGYLSSMVYDVTPGHVGSIETFALPCSTILPGAAACADNVQQIRATLLHVRDVALGNGASAEARMQSPQKFALWRVEGLGLVVAFRGTARTADMMVNLEIQPEPLRLHGQTDSTVRLHKGFYLGCLQHLEDITDAVMDAQRSNRRMPVWLTGHSLGGAYASTLMLHFLANHQQHANLFSRGGGLATFGSPFVLHAQDPAPLYRRLQQLVEDHPHVSRLHFDNVVHLGDMVPRLLGSNFASLHATLRQKLQDWMPDLLAARQATALQYRPWGAYRALANHQLRTHPAGEVTNDSEAVGSVESAAKVVRMMDLSCSLPALVAQRALAAPTEGPEPSYHSIVTYLLDLQQHMEHLVSTDPGPPVRPSLEELFYGRSAEQQRTHSGHRPGGRGQQQGTSQGLGSTAGDHSDGHPRSRGPAGSPRGSGAPTAGPLLDPGTQQAFQRLAGEAAVLLRQRQGSPLAQGMGPLLGSWLRSGEQADATRIPSHGAHAGEAEL